MLAKILGALAGEKIASRNNKTAGALIGAAIPMIARRGLGPLSVALGAGWLAKKAYDKYQQHERQPKAPDVASA